MSAHLLPSLGRPKCPDDWDLGRAQTPRGPRIAAQRRVEMGGCGLVVVDAVQAKAKRLHGDTARVRRGRRAEEWHMLFKRSSRAKGGHCALRGRWRRWGSRPTRCTPTRIAWSRERRDRRCSPTTLALHSRRRPKASTTSRPASFASQHA